MEQTLVMAKPDAVGKGVVGKIIDRFETEGFRLLALKMLRPTVSDLEGFYAEHRGKPFFEPLLEFMTSGPVIPMVWEGNGAVARVRQIVGATNAPEAAPGTLRRSWGTDNRRNLIHASDSLASAEREIAYFFKKEETAPYDSKVLA
jgi:nucleoside-diphosphate kinase